MYLSLSQTSLIFVYHAMKPIRHEVIRVLTASPSFLFLYPNKKNESFFRLRLRLTSYVAIDLFLRRKERWRSERWKLVLLIVYFFFSNCVIKKKKRTKSDDTRICNLVNLFFPPLTMTVLILLIFFLSIDKAYDNLCGSSSYYEEHKKYDD
jgi:hypothetical protein